MNMFTKFATFSATALVTMGVSVAHAQEQEVLAAKVELEAETPAAEPVNVDAPPQNTTEVAQVSANVSTDGSRPVGAGGTDHSRFVGKFAVGYLGARQVAFPGGPVQAPVIGVRYWLDSFMGLDVGLGFATGGGETDTGATTVEQPQPFAFIIHGGLPLALADSEHFVFQVVPELNFGLASNTTEGTAPAPDLEESGTQFDLGVRAGAEIHFGFIDVPQLSLQAGVGLRFSMESEKTTVGDNDSTVSRSSIGTGVGDNPWNIFTSNIAALYYFDM